MLERVQKRATRMIDGFKSIPYEECLQLLRLTTLETRRLRGDLIETFKIAKGFTNLNELDFFSFQNNVGTRGHNMKMHKGRFRTE